MRNAGITDPVDVAVVQKVLEAAMSSNPASNDPEMREQWKSNYMKMTNQMFEMNLANMAVLNQRYMDSQRDTMDTIKKYRTTLKSALDQIDTGFRTTSRMYQIAFYLGVFLILSSVALAVFKGTSLFSTAFAGLGVSDFIAYFFTKPPESLERSKADLAQLQMALYNWFNDNYNWNSFIATVASVRPVQYADMKQVSDGMSDSTEKAMAAIEAYCKFTEASSEKKDSAGGSPDQSQTAPPQHPAGGSASSGTP